MQPPDCHQLSFSLQVKCHLLGPFHCNQRNKSITRLPIENISFIPESLFKSVLNNENSKVRFEYSYLNCFICKNYWMIRDRKDKQVNNARCNHNTTLTLFSPQIRLKLNSNCKIRIKNCIIKYEIYLKEKFTKLFLNTLYKTIDCK